MFAIEFEAKIRDCVIVLASEMPLFSKPEKKHDAWQEQHGSFIEYLTDHPFQIPNPVRMTREELHER